MASTTPVDGDAFTSGYVDIDDLLAGDDLGFQMLLVHFLTERAATSNYARRIGTDFSQARVQPRPQSRDRGRGRRSCATSSATRASASSRTRRASPSAASSATAAGTGSGAGSGSAAARRAGINASSVDVVTAGNIVMTPEDYLALLERERTAAQVERERLGGATEHREGGRSVPAP